MTPLVTDSIERLRPYQGGKPIEELARERGLTNIVKLASNENPLGPSPSVRQAVERAFCDVHRYPDGAGYRLRKAIAEFYALTPGEVIHGSGSNELIELIVRTFLTPDHHMVFGTPGFSMYPVIAQAHNVAHSAVPCDADLRQDIDGLLAAVRPETKVLLIDNPGNPTGAYSPVADVERLLREVPPEVIVVLDEAYFEYVEAADYPNGLKLRHLRERLMILRTFSKGYGLAGFRVGYGIGPAELIKYVDRLRAPFNVGVLSQEAALAALADQEHLAKVVQLNQQERARLQAELIPLAARVYPSQSNFVLVDFGRDARELDEQLLSAGVITRLIPGLANCLRISIGTPEENTRLLEVLGEVLQ